MHVPVSSPEECMAAFIDAMVARDMDTALALLTDDVVLFYSNGSAIWGKADFAATMTASWKLVSNYKYKTLESVWLAKSESISCLTYTFAWSGVAGGNEVTGGGRGTRVFRREVDGWRVAHEHLSNGAWQSSFHAGLQS